MAEHKNKSLPAKNPAGQPLPISEGIRPFEYLDFLLRRKELFVIVFVAAFLTCFGLIYVFIDEQFEATALIVPREDDISNVASSVLKGMKGLPLGLGAKSASSEMDFYNTIIFSRSMMERVIGEFHLVSQYRLDTSDVAHTEKAIKRLREEVFSKETDQAAFVVTVRALTRQQAADMTNFIIRSLNERIIDLKTASSRESRIFLGKRVEEIAQQLRAAEDSLRTYQEETGLFDTKVQMQGILTAHSTLESELVARQLQKGILERMYNRDAPQVKEIDIQIQEYQKRLAQLRSVGEPGGPMLALQKLPKAAVEYLRRFRMVEINNLLLEYIMPMYEQAKIEEKKDYAILQVIDYAVPPAKKTYPPRLLFALIGALSVSLLTYLYLYWEESLRRSPSPRWEYVSSSIRQWKWKR